MIDTERVKAHLISGAQDAKKTFAAPASLAMRTISADVVPRTIESAERKMCIIRQTIRERIRYHSMPPLHTVDNEHVLALELERHDVELASHRLDAAGVEVLGSQGCAEPATLLIHTHRSAWPGMMKVRPT